MNAFSELCILSSQRPGRPTTKLGYVFPKPDGKLFPLAFGRPILSFLLPAMVTRYHSTKRVFQLSGIKRIHDSLFSLSISIFDIHPTFEPLSLILFFVSLIEILMWV